MFGELPKLLDRNFALAFYLPVATFTAASYHILNRARVLNEASLESLTANNPWLATTLVTFLTWLLAILLMAANRPLVRLKEGYGLLQNRWSPWRAYQERRWRRLQEAIAEVDAKIKAIEDVGQPLPGDLIRQEIDLHRRRSLEFPDRETWLLPTAFGNAMRSFERYSKVMYGAEAIRLWPRLLAIIPKDYREIIDSVRVQLDLWINLWFLSFVLAIEGAVLFFLKSERWPIFVTVVFVVTGWLSSRQARGAAIGWGEFIKASFDLYLPELKAKLGLADDARTDEKTLWGDYSRAILYRQPKDLPSRRPSAPTAGD